LAATVGFTLTVAGVVLASGRAGSGSLVWNAARQWSNLGLI
jgi:hypothetical protein